MSPVNSMFVCIKKIIGKSVFKMADIGKMLNIGADNRSTPTRNAIIMQKTLWQCGSMCPRKTQKLFQSLTARDGVVLHLMRRGRVVMLVTVWWLKSWNVTHQLLCNIFYKACDNVMRASSQTRNENNWSICCCNHSCQQKSTEDFLRGSAKIKAPSTFINVSIVILLLFC